MKRWLVSRDLLRSALSPWRVIGETARAYLRVDRPLAVVLVLAAILYVPPIPRATDNPQMLAAFVNDEPWITMALDGMLAKPYGNPANYLNPIGSAHKEIPAYWGHLRYDNITYYGGALFAVAMPVYAVARLAGLPAFPTAPIILRAITVLAALMSLVVLYNFAAQHASRWAGLLASLYLLTDSFFFYYTTVIHPDTLQMLLALIALAVAVRHARDGDLPSLGALGLLCGFVQGAKVGGPWTVPMAALALWWGLGASGAGLKLKPVAARVGLLGWGALLGYFLSTPYLFTNPYLYRTFKNAWQAQGVGSDSPFGQVTLWTWTTATYDHIGPLAAALVALGLVRVFAGALTSRRSQALVLAAVLSLSQFLWYAGTGKLWVILGYFIVAFGLLAVIALDTVVVLLQRLVRLTFGQGPRAALVASRAVPAGLAIIACLGGLPALLITANNALDLQLYRQSTYLALNEWASQGHLPGTARILYDDLAYFDPAKFPNAAMHGGVLTWPIIGQKSPEFVVLSSSLYGSAHYQGLIATQKLEREDRHPFSVRFYQDLLPAEQLGSTGVPDVDYVAEIKAQPITYAQPSWAPPFASPLANWPLIRLWTADSLLRRAVATLDTLASPPKTPVSGVTLRVYHLKASFGRGFASSEIQGYPASNAFDRTLAAWNATAKGAATLGQHVGYDFGTHGTRAVRQVQVQWIDGTATPEAIRVEFSDDGRSWTGAGEFEVAAYPASAPKLRADLFVLGSQNSHRFWRVVAARNAPDRGFGVAEITFEGDAPRPQAGSNGPSAHETN